MQLAFLTGNENKFREAKKLLNNVVDLRMEGLDLPEIQEIDSQKIIRAKIKEAKKYIPNNFFITDVSLTLKGMNGLPGPLIKWFMKTVGNEGLVKLTKTFGNPDAEAVVVLGYVDSEGKEHFFEGKISGRIVPPRGENGFAWDKVFQPDGFSKTFAEMSLEEKNEISMFKRALLELKKYLQTKNL